MNLSEALRKIDLPYCGSTLKRIETREQEKPCRCSEHDPPSMISLPDGIYRHTCPACGRSQDIVFSSPTL